MRVRRFLGSGSLFCLKCADVEGTVREFVETDEVDELLSEYNADETLLRRVKAVNVSFSFQK
jgi:hypothetical protein